MADYDAFLDRELERYYADQESDEEDQDDEDYDGPDPDDLPEPCDESCWPRINGDPGWARPHGR